MQKEWNNIPREKIDWHPSIDESKCSGCKTCYDFCKHKTYGWNEQNNVAVVISPLNCVVGCQNCMAQCEYGAITFPPLTYLKDLLDEYNSKK